MAQLASRLFTQLANLRVLTLIGLLFLALAGMPVAFESAVLRLDARIAKSAVDFVDLPQPKTAVTIVHVPDLDFDAWLANIAGAERLQQLIGKVGGGFAVGLVTEEPVRFIQSSTDKLVDTWSSKSNIKPQGLKEELQQLAVLRQDMLAMLRTRVIVGMPLRGSAEGRHAPWTPLDTSAIPSWLATYLWALPPSSARFDIPAVATEHLPVSAPDGLPIELLHVNGQELRESFALRLLKQTLPGSGLVSLQWQQHKGLFIGDRLLPMGYNAQYIPLYGSTTGITASATQLTLDAALRLEALSGNLIIGRDGNPVLEHAAQNFMALGDRAYWVTPNSYPWVRLVLYAILMVAAAWLWGSLPWWAGLLSVVMLQLLGVFSQVMLARISDYWLPLAEIYLALWASFGLLAVWRFHAHSRLQLSDALEQWQFRTAGLQYRAGQHMGAANTLRKIPVTPSNLRLFYRTAEKLQVTNYHREALDLWQSLPRRFRKFRDITQRIAACENAVATIQRSPHQKPDQTQVICVNTSLEQLGRYDVGEVLGHGGSGVVYRGFDPAISRDVALKTLNLNVFRHETRNQVKARFLNEVKTVGRLSHPNIVSVYDVGEHDHWAYIAMDLATGQPLSEYIKPETLLPVAEVYWVGLKVAEALAFAHAQNIVHCDIKPGNIIYNRDTYEVKVTDFGIAQWLDAAQTETGEIMGSPHYMAPEQLQGRPVSPQTDIFSLGATLHQLLTGQPPFQGRSIAEIQQAVLHSKPTAVRTMREDLPPSAARIVNRTLKKPVADRFSSASDLAFTLNKAIIRDFKDEAKQWRLL